MMMVDQKRPRNKHPKKRETRRKAAKSGEKRRNAAKTGEERRKQAKSGGNRRITVTTKLRGNPCLRSAVGGPSDVPGMVAFQYFFSNLTDQLEYTSETPLLTPVKTNICPRLVQKEISE